MSEKIFDRPVFIVSAPRAGSTLLYELLSQSEQFWTIGGESHAVIEGMPELRITKRSLDSNVLTAADSTESVVAELKNRFISELRDINGKRYIDCSPQPVRFLEKTPKNSLRIEFLRAAFPGALFIYLVRDAKENISSIMQAWRSGRFVTYPHLPGWGHWSLLLPPGWRQLVGMPLVNVAAFQWMSANKAIIDGLTMLPNQQYTLIHYDDLVRNATAVVKQISEFCQIDDKTLLNRVAEKPLALSRYTLTPPSSDKWRNNHRELMSVWQDISATIAVINQFCLTNDASVLDAVLPHFE